MNRNDYYTRVECNHDQWQFFNALNQDLDNLYFAGDLGSMYEQLTGNAAPGTLPIALGRIPLLFQDGVWMQDAVTGAAATWHARGGRGGRGSGRFDLTIFAGWDDLNSTALSTDDEANVYGVQGYFNFWGGFLETGYGFVDDTSGSDLAYHNLGLSYTRQSPYRYASTLRYIANFGQRVPAAAQTADGQLVLVETAFRTARPQTLIPYLNLFAGFDRPQSLSRAPG